MHIDQSFPFVTLHPAIDFNCSLLKRKHSVHVLLPTMKFLLSTPFARRCLHSALQSCGSLSLSASSNLHKLCSSQFVSIKSISDSLWQLSLPHDFTLQRFVSEVPCGFFLFRRSGGDNPFLLQIPYSCLSRSSFLLLSLRDLYNFKWLLVSLLLWLLSDSSSAHRAVPGLFPGASCCWSGTASPRQGCSLVLYLPPLWCKIPNLGTAVIH